MRGFPRGGKVRFLFQFLGFLVDGLLGFCLDALALGHTGEGSVLG